MKKFLTAQMHGVKDVTITKFQNSFRKQNIKGKAPIILVGHYPWH